MFLSLVVSSVIPAKKPSINILYNILNDCAKRKYKNLNRRVSYIKRRKIFESDTINPQ